MLATEIIQQLNEAHAFYRMPSMDIYYPIGVRMSAYRSARHWALVIETFIFNDSCVGHGCPMTLYYCFGDDLPQAPGWNDPPLYVTKDGPSGPLFDPHGTEQLVSPSAVDMTIRGTVVPITTDPMKYAEAGIELEDPPGIQGYELLRLLAPRHRRLFFATESEIVERIGAEMPLLIRLNEWRHCEALKETPADCETFQMIADAIAHDDRHSTARPSRQTHTGAIGPMPPWCEARKVAVHIPRVNCIHYRFRRPSLGPRSEDRRQFRPFEKPESESVSREVSR